MQWFAADLLRGFSDVGEHFVPPVLLDVLPLLLEGHSATIACDPCAGFGVLAASVNEAVHAERTIACTRSQQSLALARVLAPHLEWHTGDPLSFLEALSQQLDVVASVLPLGVQTAQAVELQGESGQRVQYAGELGSVLLAVASLRLAPEGVGIFVVSASFFFAQRSILRDLPLLGLGVEAALALPAGSFAPFARISTYLVVVRKRALAEMFVAQLSQDTHTNRQIVANLRERNADGASRSFRLHDLVVLKFTPRPRPIPERRPLRRRVHDVGEHHRGEHAAEFGLLVADLPHEPLDLGEQLLLIPCPIEVVEPGNETKRAPRICPPSTSIPRR